ncbi:hypothetical protein N5915_05745 [Arcobacter lacus]|uniref:hypothetical protein n=1 Tax=Arcobacter lacus TaxID=1912876 RepID=UPI0021BBA858|nr:hypothetical protein [Arcobacter lacus]MCT7909057.1 hypothetical protein [Arcobacter lacus]
MKKILLMTVILLSTSYGACGSPYEFGFWDNYKCVDGDCKNGEGTLECKDKKVVHTLKGTFKDSYLEKGVEELKSTENELIYKKEGDFRKGEFWNFKFSSTKKPELYDGYEHKKIDENCEETTHFENRVIKNIKKVCKEKNGDKLEYKYNKNGDLEEITTYFIDGNIEKRVAEYKNGKQDGKTLVYYKNGNISEVQFKEGSMVGEFINIDRNGNKSIFETKDGETNGKLSGHDEYGNKIEGFFINGKPEGKFTTFFTNGDKDKEILQYKDGKRNGESKIYFKNGDILKGQFEDDNIINEEYSYKRKTKGYLEKDFKITNKDNHTEIIEKGTYLEISEDRKHIIFPEKYNLISFDKAPILKVSANQIDIKIDIKKDETNSRVISFELDTNIKINSIEIYDSKMDFKDDEDYKYIINKIELPRDDFSLIILLEDNATIIYDCNINGKCNPKNKKEI